ncbi:MAG: hypothetical protein RIR77_2079 [Planctomycetota bacterium]|jgi:hypothetical protein
MAIENTVVEAIHKWQLDQRVHGDEEAARLTALTNALKGSDRLKVVRAFFDYLDSATKYRSIWIPQIAALMNAVNQAAAKKSFEGPTFVVARDGFGWLEEQHRKNQPRFDAGIDKWTKQLPERLAAIHTANGGYRSQGLLDLPGEIAYLVSRVEVHNQAKVHNQVKDHTPIRVPQLPPWQGPANLPSSACKFLDIVVIRGIFPASVPARRCDGRQHPGSRSNHEARPKGGNGSSA